MRYIILLLISCSLTFNIPLALGQNQPPNQPRKSPPRTQPRTQPQSPQKKRTLFLSSPPMVPGCPLIEKKDEKVEGLITSAQTALKNIYDELKKCSEKNANALNKNIKTLNLSTLLKEKGKGKTFTIDTTSGGGGFNSGGGGGFNSGGGGGGGVKVNCWNYRYYLKKEFEVAQRYLDNKIVKISSQSPYAQCVNSNPAPKACLWLVYSQRVSEFKRELCGEAPQEKKIAKGITTAVNQFKNIITQAHNIYKDDCKNKDKRLAGSVLLNLLSSTGKILTLFPGIGTWTGVGIATGADIIGSFIKMFKNTKTKLETSIKQFAAEQNKNKDLNNILCVYWSLQDYYLNCDFLKPLRSPYAVTSCKPETIISSLTNLKNNFKQIKQNISHGTTQLNQEKEKQKISSGTKQPNQEKEKKEKQKIAILKNLIKKTRIPFEKVLNIFENLNKIPNSNNGKKINIKKIINKLRAWKIQIKNYRYVPGYSPKPSNFFKNFIPIKKDDIKSMDEKTPVSSSYILANDILDFLKKKHPNKPYYKKPIQYTQNSSSDSYRTGILVGSLLQLQGNILIDKIIQKNNINKKLKKFFTTFNRLHRKYITNIYTTLYQKMNKENFTQLKTAIINTIKQHIKNTKALIGNNQNILKTTFKLYNPYKAYTGSLTVQLKKYSSFKRTPLKNKIASSIFHANHEFWNISHNAYKNIFHATPKKGYKLSYASPALMRIYKKAVNTYFHPKIQVPTNGSMEEIKVLKDQANKMIQSIIDTFNSTNPFFNYANYLATAGGSFNTKKLKPLSSKNIKNIPDAIQNYLHIKTNLDPDPFFHNIALSLNQKQSTSFIAIFSQEVENIVTKQTQMNKFFDAKKENKENWKNNRNRLVPHMGLFQMYLRNKVRKKLNTLYKNLQFEFQEAKEAGKLPASKTERIGWLNTHILPFFKYCAYFKSIFDLHASKKNSFMVTTTSGELEKTRSQFENCCSKLCATSGITNRPLHIDKYHSIYCSKELPYLNSSLRRIKNWVNRPKNASTCMGNRFKFFDRHFKKSNELLSCFD